MTVTEERTCEVQRILAAIRPGVEAVGIVGSWARGDTRIDPDLDPILPTVEKSHYLANESWVTELGGLHVVDTQQWKPLNER